MREICLSGSDVHHDLDAAVAAAYGWPEDISEEDALAKLLELNLKRAGTTIAAETENEDENEGAAMKAGESSWTKSLLKPYP